LAAKEAPLRPKSQSDDEEEFGKQPDAASKSSSGSKSSTADDNTMLISIDRHLSVKLTDLAVGQAREADWDQYR
jgi:hypothetical protein